MQEQQHAHQYRLTQTKSSLPFSAFSRTASGKTVTQKMAAHMSGRVTKRSCRRSGGKKEQRSIPSLPTALPDWEIRLASLESALSARLSSAANSLFPPVPPAISRVAAYVRDQLNDDGVASVAERVGRLALGEEERWAEQVPLVAPQPVYPVRMDDLPDVDNALEQVAALHSILDDRTSTLFAPLNPSSSPTDPWTAPLLQPSNADAQAASLLCSLRQRGHFASMSLFPELASSSPPPSSSSCPPSAPSSHHYASSSSSPPSSSSHTPFFSRSPSPSPSSCSAASEVGSCTTDATPPSPYEELPYAEMGKLRLEAEEKEQASLPFASLSLPSSPVLPPSLIRSSSLPPLAIA